MTKTIAPAKNYVQDYSTNVLHFGYRDDHNVPHAYCNRSYNVYVVGVVGIAADDADHGRRMVDSCARCIAKQAKALG